MRSSLLWRAAFGAVALYAVATVALTWPLFRHPASTVLDCESLYGPAAYLVQSDINLTMWTLAWDSRALVTDPLHVFDANVFYPARFTLASSEHKLGNVPLFAPVYLLTTNPVLAHQLTLLMSFVLSGLCMAAWAFYWTEDQATALVAGFFYAFAPYRFWQIGSLDYISLEYLPLVLLGIDMVLDGRGGPLGAGLLAVGLVLSSLCSYYTAYATFVMAGVYTLVGWLTADHVAVGRLLRLAVVGGTAAVVIVVVTIPYVILQRRGVLPNYGEQGFGGLAFLFGMKFGLLGMLSTFILPRRWGIPEFVCFTAMVLALVGLVIQRRRPRGALLAIGFVGVLLALGPDAFVTGLPAIPLPYRLLARIVPGFSAMRVPQRFGALATLAAIGLAVFGLAALRQWFLARGYGRLAAGLAALAVVTFLWESTPRGLRPFAMRVGDAIPPVYRWLAAHGDGGPVIELPAQPLDLYRESVFVYYSTYHWLPLVNGYSGYPAQSYRDIMEIALKLPDPAALRALLERVALRWVVVHPESMPQSTRAAYEAPLRTRLRFVGALGDDLLFEVPSGPRESR